MLKNAFNSVAFNDRFLTFLDTTKLFIVTKYNFAASESISAFRIPFE